MNPIVGHQNICAFFEHALSTDTLFHAYGFIGQEGIGKRATALWLASTVLATPSEKVYQHMDFLFVQRGIKKDRKRQSKISKDQIDSVKEFLVQKPFLGRWKVVIVDEIETLEESAANAFLKTLEEPPKGRLIILLMKSDQDLPATIASRCHFIHFFPVAQETIAEWLRAKGIAEPQKIAALSQGLPGKAMDLSEDPTRLAWAEEELGRLDDLLRMPLYQKAEQIKKLLPAKDEETIIARERLAEAFSLWRLGLRSWIFRADVTPFRSRSHIAELDQTIVSAISHLRANANPRLVTHHLLSLFP